MDRLNELAASIEVGINQAAIAQARIIRGIDLTASEILRRMDERHQEITGWELKSHVKAIATLAMTDAVQQVVNKFGDRLQVAQWQDSAWLSLAERMFDDADEVFSVKTLNAHRAVQKKHDDQQAGIQAMEAISDLTYGTAPATKHVGMNEGRALDAAGAMLEIEQRERRGRNYPAKRSK